MSDSATDAPDPPPERRGLLRSVLESTAVGLAVLCGPDLVYEFLNPAYQALSPYRVMLGRPFESVWPEAVERILPIFRQVGESGAPFEAADMRVDIQRSPGGPLEASYFSFACRRLARGPGQAPAVLVHVVDTTPLVLARRRAEDRVRTEAMLRAAEHDAREEAERARDRFELLTRLIAEVNDVADLDAVVGTALRWSVRLLQADDGVLRLVEEGGSSLRTFVELRDAGRMGEVLRLDLLPHARRAVESGQAVYFTAAEAQGGEAGRFGGSGHASSLILPLTRGGAAFGLMHVDWKARASPMSAQDVAFARAMADHCALAISRASALEAEKAARAVAEGLARRQEMMSTILAHDLRSPIEAIGLTSQALIHRDGLDARQADAVRRIAVTARRMGTLVEDLLDLARARQAGGIPVERRRTDIEPVCSRAIQQLLDSHPGGRVQFARSGPGEGTWDPDRLEQVVSNLVGNALERAPAGSAVEVRAAGSDGELVLTVRNQGPPIPEEQLASLFDPFHRGDGRGSIGLGLYIVSEIVRAHGGEVGVTSDRAAGTCFTVRLPRSGPEG